MEACGPPITISSIGGWQEELWGGRRDKSWLKIGSGENAINNVDQEHRLPF